MRLRQTITVIVLLLVFLSACAPERTYVDTLSMTAGDCDSRLYRWSVRSGDPIHLDFENPSDRSYTWVLLGKVIKEPFDPSDLDGAYTTIEIPAATTIRTAVNIPLAPGEYQVLCGPTGGLDGKVVSLLTVTLLEEAP